MCQKLCTVKFHANFDVENESSRERIELSFPSSIRSRERVLGYESFNYPTPLSILRNELCLQPNNGIWKSKCFNDFIRLNATEMVPK